MSASQPNGLAVPDASMHQVTSTSDVLELMKIGLANRAVGATALNERSSRSHSVVTIHVRGTEKKTGASLRGYLHLVDLAGSERVDRSEVTGDRLKEAQHINKSLSALGDVIFSLSQKSAYVPYRNSKLTQVLQSSLGGQAKTLMFVQINPDVQSYSETSSTLKFAERVSGVELGAAKSNKENKDIRELMEQVASLKDTVARKDVELEHLQLLKDLGTQSPSSNSERQGRNSLNHSSCAHQLHGMAIPKGRGLSCGKVVTSNKSVSDNGNSSDFSDKHSENSSRHSLDDFKHQKEYLAQPKLAAEYRGLVQPKMAAEYRGQSSSTDIELLGFGDADADAEERLSDISDGGLSMGGETDGTLELSLFPEHGKIEHDKTVQVKIERMHRVPSKMPNPTSQKIGQTTTRSEFKDPLKTSSLRKSTSSQTIVPSAKTAKRRQ